MGILDGGMVTPQLARSKKLPVEYGMLLAGVIDNMGAEKAGLSKGDLITEVNGVPFKDGTGYWDVLKEQTVGGFVEISYYRGNEKKIAKVEMTARPVPPIPSTAQDLAEEIDAVNKNIPVNTTNAVNNLFFITLPP